MTDLKGWVACRLKLQSKVLPALRRFAMVLPFSGVAALSWDAAIGTRGINCERKQAERSIA